jgi:hypothetical protein
VRHVLAEAFTAHVNDLRPAGDTNATLEWIAANVDGLLATIERLYAVAVEGHPGSHDFLDRMAWLSALLADIEQGAGRLDA